jgi:pyruvate,water dikinase
MAERRWRAELARWDAEVKPAALRAHKALQAVDPAALDDGGLANHLQACFDHIVRMVEQHHHFTIDCCLPMGDFLAHAKAWTNLPVPDLLQCVRGSSKISTGVAADELQRLAAALRADPASAARLDLPPSEAVPALLTAPGDAGAAMRAYVDLVGYRALGYDVCEPFTLEMPAVIVKAIRATLAGAKPAEDTTAQRVARVREAVPAPHRATFDALLEEVRFVNRLRDERGFYSESFAVGLMRRAALETGRRLVARGRLDAAGLAVDADLDELKALLAGRGGPTAEDLRSRAEWRRAVTSTDAPRWLGAPPSPPPPSDWLPAHARRADRAMQAFLSALFDEPPAQVSEKTVRGLPVSSGRYEGTARVVIGEQDFGRIEPGDVLVTRATSPTFNVVLPLLGGLVTDRGGQLSHAAIVAREYGIPGVVGTMEGTRVIRDGARVRVDGASGEVTVLA